ncbi:MAG: replication-associated recombination protein A, partial [Frankiaceae bacterium]|nr:replication-associated recombination protein A [Frankiaceae bacterium]
RVTLIGTTTHNPFFAVNGPLLSRSSLFRFEPLSREAIKELLRRALADRERGLGEVPVEADDDALAFLAEASDGDARRALTALEVGVLSSSERPVRFTRPLAEEAIQRKALNHDGTGDEHYDVTSAFIKSIRGGDVDASLHYLARMVEAGEDPRFIARRLVILASEDVGLADPQALTVAVAAAQAVQLVGLPEGRLNLAEATIYLALAPKSNAVIRAIEAAAADVRAGLAGPVPAHLRDSHYPGAKRLQHGKGYRYPHDFPDGVVQQQYAPDAVADRDYYHPADRGAERTIAARLAALRGAVRGDTERKRQD